MKKLPVFVLAAATAIIASGVPMTAQAATCPVNVSNCFSSSFCGQSGNINDILNRLGCTQEAVSQNKNSNCSNLKGAFTNNGFQCRTISNCRR